MTLNIFSHILPRILNKLRNLPNDESSGPPKRLRDKLEAAIMSALAVDKCIVVAKLLTIAAICICLTHKPAVAMTESVYNFDPFSKLHVYHQSQKATNIVLLVSGENGWDEAAVQTASVLYKLGATVVGIDTVDYLKSHDKAKQCFNFGKDFKHMSQFIEKRLHYDTYDFPLLVGISSGATLAYAALQQGAPNTFAGGIGVSYSPRLLLSASLCPHDNLNWKIQTQQYNKKSAGNAAKFSYVLDQSQPVPDDEPWIRLAGDSETREASLTRAFNKINDARAQRQALSPDSLKDLPLKSLPVAKPEGKPLAIIVSGDGGWADMDRQIASTLNENGVSVVGVNSLQYFWKKKSPDTITKDLSRVLDGYARDWKYSNVMLIGYSLGAEIMPFAVPQLRDDQKRKIKIIALLGPGKEAKFQFHILDWLNLGKYNKTKPLLPEMDKLIALKVICVYGKDDEAVDNLCPLLNARNVKIIPLPGRHHFDHNYKALAERILEEAGG